MEREDTVGLIHRKQNIAAFSSISGEGWEEELESIDEEEKSNADTESLNDSFSSYGESPSRSSRRHTPRIKHDLLQAPAQKNSNPFDACTNDLDLGQIYLEDTKDQKGEGKQSDPSVTGANFLGFC